MDTLKLLRTSHLSQLRSSVSKKSAVTSLYCNLRYIVLFFTWRRIGSWRYLPRGLNTPIVQSLVLRKR
ncbi:hypothetical protein OMP06_19206 (plasmid) [Acinetobacter baumannii]|nr:hypothetical protein OMP06_19206 [Acinetobacter baumannii]